MVINSRWPPNCRWVMQKILALASIGYAENRKKKNLLNSATLQPIGVYDWEGLLKKNCSLKSASKFLFKESHRETFYSHLDDFRCKHPKKYIMYVVKKYTFKWEIFI